MNKIIIIGSGGHARACLDIINSQKKFKFSGFIDNTSKDKKVIGKDKDLKKISKRIKFACIGFGGFKNSVKRVNFFLKLKKIGFKLPVIKSSEAYVSKSAKIGEGSIIMHGAIINACAEIGKNTIINTGVLIEHDTLIEDNCHVATRAVINGNCLVQKNTFIGSNSTIINNIKIGRFKFIKANSLIKKDLI